MIDERWCYLVVYDGIAFGGTRAHKKGDVVGVAT